MMAYRVQNVLPPSAPVVFGSFPGRHRRGNRHEPVYRYLLPFEVTSVLILIAILGAIVLARKEIE